MTPVALSLLGVTAAAAGVDEDSPTWLAGGTRHRASAAARVSPPPTGPAEPLGRAVAAFLTERDLAPSSRRVYALTLNRFVAQ
ncbi:MAG TPA: hypothetical protein VFC16_13910 [Nakamurella sp.]|nr:hypothetical protein [Nakamurella sp.]